MSRTFCKIEVMDVRNLDGVQVEVRTRLDSTKSLIQLLSLTYFVTPFRQLHPTLPLGTSKGALLTIHTPHSKKKPKSPAEDRAVIPFIRKVLASRLCEELAADRISFHSDFEMVSEYLL